MHRSRHATQVVLALVLISTGDLRAQVTIEMSRITCEQFVLYQIPNSDYIPTWMHGFYSAKKGITTIDTQQFKTDTEKVRQYCRLNSKVPLMQAVETVLGFNK
jgi:acid stress chaperone HdeB